jgi:hypothetical protein
VPNPQQPELRRNDKGPATDQEQRKVQLSTTTSEGGRPHGTDRGAKGGGEGGGTPPAQQGTDERITSEG